MKRVTENSTQKRTESRKARAEERARSEVAERRELMGRKQTSFTILFIVIFASALIYIGWRLLFTLPIYYGIPSIVCGVILWVCEAVTVMETFTHFNNARKVKLPEMPQIPDHMFPDVDVIITTHNESASLLFKTINGCKHMDYPDTSKIHIILSDDGQRPEIKELAARMGIQYFAVDDGNTYAKAGNFNYSFHRSNSPLVAIFDADMIPTSDFLLETVPYFYDGILIKDKNTGEWRLRTEDDPEDKRKPLAYVQTQQSFYNPDPLQRNLYMENSAPNEQDYFYRSVNVARMHSESSAFAGSNTVFTRESLESNDGLATHSITEDFATSIALLGKGYRTIAVAKELAHGMSPEDVPSFIKQRQRWSRGAAQAIMTKKFWFSGMSLKQKWAFLMAYGYWWTFVRRFVFLLCPIVYALFGIRVADVTFLQLITIWLPYYVVYSLGLQIMSGRTTSALWSDRIDTIQFPYLMGSIIKGTLMIPQGKFIVTDKDQKAGRNSSIKLAWPHIILAILTTFAILVCLYDVFVHRIDGSIIVLFWASYNMIALLSAIVYYAGRENERHSERVPVPVDIEIVVSGRSISGSSMDISEGGLAVILDFPEYIPFEANSELTVRYAHYQASMYVKIMQVVQVNERWKYSMSIVDIDEKNFGEYLQILYDRNHLFPRIVDVGVVKDFRLMYEGLHAKKSRGERRLPRIPLNCSVEASEIGSVTVYDFNYHFITLSGSGLPQRLTVHFPYDIDVVCTREENIARASVFATKTSLYAIENWEELISNEKLHDSLAALMRSVEIKHTPSEEAIIAAVPLVQPDRVQRAFGIQEYPAEKVNHAKPEELKKGA